MPVAGVETKVRGIDAIGEQMLQIAADYNGLPDVRTLTIPEIRYFFSGLIYGLIERQKKEREK